MLASLDELHQNGTGVVARAPPSEPPLPRVVTGPRVPEVPARSPSHREVRGKHGPEHREALEQLAPPSMLVDESHRIIGI
jgi:hypothetical protein